MKVAKLLFVFFLLFVSYQRSFSQQRSEDLILLFSSANPTYEDLAHHTDYLASEVSKSSGSLGYIIIYGGANPIENKFYEITIYKSLAFRGFNKGKFKIISSTDSSKLKTEFWISKNGAKPDVKENVFSLILSTEKATRFADDLLEIVKIDGKEDFYSIGCDAGCIISADFYLLASFLNQNPKLKSFVIIHAGNSGKARHIKKLLSKKIFNEAGISPLRLNFLYGGKNQINNKMFFEIEVYLAKNELQLQKLNLKSYKSIN